MSQMTVPGQAVQVLKLLDDQQHPGRQARQLKLDTQVLRDIAGKVDTAGYPLAIIVIAGPERQGKSFILTYFVRYLQALEKSEDGVVGDWMEKSNPEISMRDRGFNFENSFERTTEGIWMWSRPFIIPQPSNTTEKIAVLLMDTEGCSGSSLTNQEQAALVGLSLLTSSVFIYNETTRINESTLATVGKFMQYGQLASQTFHGKIFHRIMFLIRDWNCPKIHEYGAAGGQGFMREFFREKPGMTKEAVEHRRAIVKHFEDCSAYLMPHPGQTLLSDKFTGSLAEMTPEFCYHLENCVTSLIADVAPKMLRDNTVTGSGFASLFQAYVKAFNATDMPSPASILKATLHIALDTEIKSLAGSYESSLRNRIIDADSSGHMVTPQQLDKWGRKIADSILSSFEKKEHRCPKEDKIVYIERLKVETERVQKRISEENETARNKFIRRSATAAVAAFQSFLEKHVKLDDHYWKRPEFDQRVNPAQEEHLQSLLKTCSSVPAEYLQPILTDVSNRMDQIQETLWTELTAKIEAAENEASEIVMEILVEYISNMELLVLNDVQPEATVEKFHNKEASTVHASFKRRMETQFKDTKFIMESTEVFNQCLEAEYKKFKECNASKLDEIRGRMDAEIGKAVARFKQESSIATGDQSMLKEIYGSVLELALEAFENIAVPDSRFLHEYIRKLRAALKAALDEALTTFIRSVEAKQLKCKQLAQNALQEFKGKLSSWIQTTGTVSPATFDDRSAELIRNELSKCEAEMRLVMCEYSSYLRDVQELMEQSRLESTAANSTKLEESDRFAFEQSAIIKRSYEASMQKSLDQCKDLTDLKKLHEEVSSKLLRQFSLELESCSAYDLYDSYEATCKKQIMEIFNEKQKHFLQKTEGLKQLRTQVIPQRVEDLRVRSEDKIRRNPFISDADVDAILQEEWPEVMHSLVREIKSQIAFSLTEVVALVDEIESQLSKTQMELKRNLRVERAEGNDKVEAINQSLIDFATIELNQVVGLLLNGTRSNVEEYFQTLKAKIDSKFEDEWPYELSSKKESIKQNILTKLDDQIHNSRQKVLKKMNDDEAKLVLGYMNTVLSSFAKPMMEILDAGKHIACDKLESQLKEEMKQKVEEFQLLLQTNKVEPAKHIGEMTQQLKTKKRWILQTNVQVVLEIIKDLPVSTVAIHMGLRHTRIGLFRPGKKEFVNLGLVEHKLYYRDDTILLAYDVTAKQKLGEPDLDFVELLVRGPIDELIDVNLGGRTRRVRKEEIFSLYFAALKRRAEIETMMKLQDCVIVVPQFLNIAQRRCIGDAGKIAGFIDVKLIDDTAATVLEHIMSNKISSGPVIAISALEGPIDIARFMTRSGVPKCTEISGSNFMNSERHRQGVLTRTLNATWTLTSRTTTEEGNPISKMLSYTDFDVGSYKVDCDIKVFVGGEEDFIKLKAALPHAESKSFIKTSELSPLRGGAYMAAICKGNMSCPIFSRWNSLRADGRWKPSHEEFEKELLSMIVKERKRMSNFPSEDTVYLTQEDIGKITNVLRGGAQLHDEAIKAVRVLRAITEACGRKRIRNVTAIDVLTSLSMHLSELKQPNLRMEEAKRIRDDLVDTWCQYVQGHDTPASSQN